MPTRILSSDILIADIIAERAHHPKLVALAEKYGLKHGGKAPLDEKKFKEFSAAISDCPVTITPGGSSANTLATMSRLLGNGVNIDMLGVIGKGAYSYMIEQSLQDDNIQLWPKELPADKEPESAVSFILTAPKTDRTIATYKGNIHKILEPKYITDDLIDKADVVLVQGSLWQKLNETIPVEGAFADEENTGFADKLLKLRWEKGKELWLTMPTQADLGTKIMSHDDKAKLFQALAETANIVASNGEELAVVYTSPEERRKSESITAEEALKRLQKVFQKETLVHRQDESPDGRPLWTGPTHQVGFITLGEKGAAIVTKDSIQMVGAHDIEVNNTLGAGDAAYAGFFAAYVKQKDKRKEALDMNDREQIDTVYRHAAEIGMALGGAKVESKEPRSRLENPLKILEEKLPGRWDALDSKWVNKQRAPVREAVVAR